MEMFSILPLGDIILPERLNCPFYYQPHPLCLLAAEEVKVVIGGMDEWLDEVSRGKMFGVLVTMDREGRVGYLKAYSGQIGGREDWDGWVPAVFDYLQPDGYFVTHEAAITSVNEEIYAMEHSERHRLDCARLAKAESEGARRIEEYRQYMTEEKQRRRTRRASGEDDSVLVRESQYQKAEMKRLKNSVECEMRPYRDIVMTYDAQLATLRSKRKQMSDELQRWLFSQFVMLNGRGERRDLLGIFRDTPQAVPPSGAGECCAPKLLQYAFAHDLRPVAMAEFWWGRSPVGEIRNHLSFYPACQGKCRPILDFMLQGVAVEQNSLESDEPVDSLRVVYEDEWLVIVDKPSGMLSVPGKGQRLSALDILQGQQVSPSLYPVHRLDMQTSGLLLFAKSLEMQKIMQRLFACRQVKKHYTAVLDGEYSGATEGEISLPLAPDYINRPRQKVDYKEGKTAITHYIIREVMDGKTHVDLYPHTGRTHQLRVHCAHPDGLGVPIVGDDLYGTHADRLMLCAQSLTFVHPVTGKEVVFEV